MKTDIISEKLVNSFEIYLIDEEKSENTVAKYIRDVKAFIRFAEERDINKETVLDYKRHLTESGYGIRSIISMLASLNSFFTFSGLSECRVKAPKLQKQIFRPEDRELTKSEYERLVKTAEADGNKRLFLLLQTVCGTGIRISELKYITVEAVKKGEATVSCKAKTRSVFIVSRLRKKLLRYAAEQGIKSGMIFITRTGKAMSRTNIWREMKKLCIKAEVKPSKVFPHNLRHLFARSFYGIERDIAKLADILGHSSIDTTRIYIIATGNEHRRKMENMRLIL